MEENTILNKFGEELPLPPENPIDEGIVIPITPPEDGEKSE